MRLRARMATGAIHKQGEGKFTGQGLTEEWGKVI